MLGLKRKVRDALLTLPEVTLQCLFHPRFDIGTNRSVGKDSTSRKLLVKVDERTCFITIFNTKRGVGKRKKNTPKWGAEKNPDVGYAGETRS